MNFFVEQQELIIDVIKTYVISICIYYMNLKFIVPNNKVNVKDKIICATIMFIIANVFQFLKIKLSFLFGVIFMALMISLVICTKTKINYGHSLIITVISTSINYILFVAAILASFIFLKITKIEDKYINLAIILFAYTILVRLFLKIKKFNKGLSFLNKKLKDEYFEILILNISIIILFFAIAITNYEQKMIRNFGTGFIIFSVTAFLTIQKSLKLYYKQKLLVQELNDAKAEIESKNKEIQELEKENLNFSKTSHSIAHKQKSLEYKLNQLMLKNEISSEIDLKDRLDNITKDLKSETTVELSKTGITEIDDMLSCMQSECIKNKIDFQLQLSGNIYYMINNHIDKEKLEILLADLIKNSIIAINYSENSNKSILVRLGIIDGIYSLYVYDSGIEFEIETLKNLEIKPSTTHKDSGGTGMGMLNTFDTLKQYKASMIINEIGKPCKENFTKVIKIKFDQKNEFKIESYREITLTK